MDLDDGLDFCVKRLVIVKRLGKGYYYWRKTYNIDRENIFHIRFGNDNYIMRAGKLLENWDECCDAIDAAVIAVEREKKISQILND